MTFQDQIEELLLIADGYLLELCEDLLNQQKKGCTDCGDAVKIEQLVMLSEALKYRVSIEDYSNSTYSLYECLLKAVGAYSGAAVSLDPNSDVPNIIIVIEETQPPQWRDVMWSDMESSDEDINGARYTFRAPWLYGWNPALSEIGGVMYQIGVQYDMYQDGEDGVFRLRSGFGIYDQGYVRFENYNSFTAPVLPPVQVGIALIENRSSQSITYNDNFAGNVTLPSGQQYFKDPIISNQTMRVDVPAPQSPFTVMTITYTRYNPDGTVDFTLSVPRPPSAGILTVSAMDIAKRHIFIITET